MGVSFENPWWLLLLVLAAPVVVTGLVWFASMSRARAVSAVVFRSVLIALLAGVLAGASAVHTSDRMATIVIVDVSDSVRQFAGVSTGPDGRPVPITASISQWLDGAAAASARGPDDLLGVVVFDGEAMAVRTPRPIAAIAQNGQTPGPAGPNDFIVDFRLSDGTNIEQALRLAASMFPPDAARRLVLISDGNQTSGDAVSAARELAAGSVGAGSRTTSAPGGAIPIDTIPLVYRVQHEVMVEAVDAPPLAAAESTVTVRVVLTATEAAEGLLELLYNGHPLDINGGSPGTGQPVTLSPGTNVKQVRVKLTPDQTVHKLRPVFVPDRLSADRITTNNSAETFTITPGKGAVLVIDGVGAGSESSPGRILPATLERAGINVQVIPPEAAPSDLLSLQAFDLVILQNVAADQIPRNTQQLLADYVTDLGGGLVMVGGPDSFGAGGWKGTPLEPVLPVNLDLPEQLLVPSAAVMIVIDNSGSMSAPVGGTMLSQQQVANEGAAMAIETLDKSDLVGVISFNGDFRIEVPFGPNSNPRRNADRVRAIGTGGGTNLYPAMMAAAEMLSGAEAAVKHMIVLTDGQSQGDANDGFAVASEMRKRGMTVSSIAIGDGADVQVLEQIARLGGGKFYRVNDPTILPRVFIKDIRVVRKPLIREGNFTPQDTRSGSPLTAGLPVPFKPLGGLVLTQRRKDPKINLAMVTPQGEPVLASWYVGRGQVAAFTSDAHDKWARQWIEWPGYTMLWTQIARSIARPASERNAELTSEIVADELIVRLDSMDDEGRPLDLLTVPGKVYPPDGKPVEVRLAQVGPGSYITRVPASQRGNYFVALMPRQGERNLAPVFGGTSRALGDEFRALQSNAGLMRQIAEAGGGRLLNLAHPEQADLFNRSGLKPQPAPSPIWRVLLIWSLAVLLLDVATRRVAWDRLFSREFAMELREQAAAAVRARADRAAATVAALRHATERVQPQPPAVSNGQPAIARPTAEDGRAQAERMERLRAEMAGRSPQAPTPNAGDTGKAGEDAGSTTSGLLAAKRRARARFDNDQQNPGAKP